MGVGRGRGRAHLCTLILRRGRESIESFVCVGILLVGTGRAE